jgi:UDP-N-acetylmuramate: L-alanyl-gamma-D-glutamyl-meso-diaminopimelate ligase
LNKKKIHFIAIGGAAMHNIALDMKAQGNDVTGSDDEIYEPSLSRLKEAGIAPEAFGWFPEKIHGHLDMVILGMHAKSDNPELLKAVALGVKVYSYPEFVYQHSQDKKRVVVAGSHGKTTTTAMILHVLKKTGHTFDYLVGAQLDGFERMVQLTDAPLIIIEGDEYLSSPIDRIPKILHYKPDIAVITGIAWDHINVFTTFEMYQEQFLKFVDTIVADGVLIYYETDVHLKSIIAERPNGNHLAYQTLERNGEQVVFENQSFPVSVIGDHNFQNMNAARLVCQQLGINYDMFFGAIRDFIGASKRLQKIAESEHRVVYLDFAHAPSKVKATTDAFKHWFGEKKLLAVLELHTFSSLNPAFIPEYHDSLNAADKALVFFNVHTLKMKNMPDLDEEFITDSFGHSDIKVFTDEKLLLSYLTSEEYRMYNILLMTSGNFNKMSLEI